MLPAIPAWLGYTLLTLLLGGGAAVGGDLLKAQFPEGWDPEYRRAKKGMEWEKERIGEDRKIASKLRSEDTLLQVLTDLLQNKKEASGQMFAVQQAGNEQQNALSSAAAENPLLMNDRVDISKVLGFEV